MMEINKQVICDTCKKEIPPNEFFNVLADAFGFPYSIICKECKK